MKQRRYFKDVNKRKIYKNTELIQRVIKIFSIVLNTNILKWILFEYINNKFNNFKTKLKNFCVISGRSKGVIKKFKISRIVLRELSFKGGVFGLKKASW
jgi:ribosomal protein S14